MRWCNDQAAAWGRKGVLAGTLGLALAGCDHRLDSIDGYELGEPSSVVFGHNPQSRLMIVMSDLPSLCSDLQHSEPPSDANYWVMSLWTGSAAETEGLYGGEAFVAVTRAGETEEYSTDRADLDIADLTEDEIDFEVDAVFDETGDRLGAKLSGEACDARLFQGLE